MPDVFLNQRIRLAGDGLDFSITPRNLLTSRSESLRAWSRAAAQFEISHMPGGRIASLENFSFVTFQLKDLGPNGNAPSADSPALVEKILPPEAFDTTVTDETWADGSKQHFLFSLTDEEMAWTGVKWLVVFGTSIDTPARTIPIRCGKIEFVNLGGRAGIEPPPIEEARFWNADEADARYWKRSEADQVGGPLTLVDGGDGTPAIPPSLLQELSLIADAGDLGDA